MAKCPKGPVIIYQVGGGGVGVWGRGGWAILRGGGHEIFLPLMGGGAKFHL